MNLPQQNIPEPENKTDLLEYLDVKTGLTVVFDFALDIIELLIPVGVWFSIARAITKTIGFVANATTKKIVCHVTHVKETIEIEWETSKARVRAAKLIEITKVYEFHKLEVEKIAIPLEAKTRLVGNLDRMLDRHTEEIIHAD